MREVSPNEYVIKQGEYLARIMRKVYGVSDDLIFHEYMALVKKLNPGISNPNLIKPGQKLILPDIKRVMAKAKNSQGTCCRAVIGFNHGHTPTRCRQDPSGPALVMQQSLRQSRILPYLNSHPKRPLQGRMQHLLYRPA